ncbi:MAG: phospholipid carrier-dependent glycosyltransferase, partial [Pirellulaceae bacterium]|nr:phospholipid carrier-dependent glycosyltransferase [Pirellulaceae bacterium]
MNRPERMPAAEPPDRRWPWLLWLVTGGLLLLTMPRFLYVGDPLTIRATTIHLLREADLSAPSEVATRFGERGQHFYQHPGNQRWYSKYGVLNALAYVPPLLVESFVSGELRHYHQLDDTQLATRGLWLNLWNVLLSLILATYLYYLAGLHGGSPRAAWWFVLLALFGTFLWHYLRAQTVEIFQVLLFTAAYYHFVRFSDQWRRDAGRPALQAAAAVGLLGLLSLAKTVYVVLLPLGLLLVAAYAWTVPRADRHAPPAGAGA